MKHPLRIALLTYATKPRGSVVHTLELAEALHDLGHHVCVFALDKDGEGFYRPLRCDSRLIPTRPAPKNMEHLIRQRIQEFVDYLSAIPLHYDCFHAQDCLSANAIAILRSSGQIPHFMRTVHHIEAFNSPYLRYCQDRSIQQADRCLCVSHFWQAALQAQYQVEATVVTNGVNTQRFTPNPNDLDLQLKQELDLQGSPLFLTVGGIEPRKNSIALLKAFADVRKDYPQAQLIIAGGATLFDYQAYRNEFFAIADELNLMGDRALVLPGIIPDAKLPALYRLANAFVFPSLKEGWGLTVLEAMASGLPVITSNQPPFTEFLSDRDALLVSPHSIDAIAQAMRTSLHPDIAPTLIHQGWHIANRYTWKTSAQQHLQEYQQLLHSKTPSY